MNDDADAMLAELGARLADDIEAALPGWVERCVLSIHDAWHGSTPDEVRAAASRAADAAVADVVPRLRELLATDVDAQWTNPLQLMRGAVRYPTEVLEDAGVPQVVRDEFAERTAPDDVYGLEPAGFVDLGEELHHVGLAWGACKARAHLMRRRGADS